MREQPVLSLQMKITVLVCGVVALALLATSILITRSTAIWVQNSIGENAADTARIIARSPIVIGALIGQRDDKEVQDFAEDIRKVTNVEYIVVMDMDGIRKSHPNPSIIGQRFVGGDENEVLLHGQEYTSIAQGTLGVSLRAFTPVVAPDGRQVGAVAVGILLTNVEQAIAQGRSLIYLAAVLGLLIGAAGAVVLAHNIKKSMFGLEPFAIAKLLEERIAMLHSVREGVLAIDMNSRITLVNEEAARIFNLAGIESDLIGKLVNDHIANSRLTEVLETGCAEFDQEQDINGIILLTNRVPIVVDDKIVGAIATFRDKTELRRMAEQLTGIRNYVEALRSQAHEFMNKLHVILGMVRLECFDQIGAYITGIAQQYQSEVGFVAKRVKDPVLAGFLLGKLSRARELGVELSIAEDCYLPSPADSEIVPELITVVGNLVDNALEAVQDCARKQVDIYFDHHDGFLSLEVTDTGIGISADTRAQMFTSGFSSKGDERGLGLSLVQRSLAKLNGVIEVSSELGEGTQFRVYIPYESKGDAE